MADNAFALPPYESPESGPLGMGNASYNVPSVYDGKINSPDNAIARAMQMGLGQFPSYQSPFEAENRYHRMHNYMEADQPAPSWRRR